MTPPPLLACCDCCALPLPPLPPLPAPLALPPLPLPLLSLRCPPLSASSQVLKRGSSGISGCLSCFSFQSLPATCDCQGLCSVLQVLVCCVAKHLQPICSSLSEKRNPQGDVSADKGKAPGCRCGRRPWRTALAGARHRMRCGAPACPAAGQSPSEQLCLIQATCCEAESVRGEQRICCHAAVR